MARRSEGGSTPSLQSIEGQNNFCKTEPKGSLATPLLTEKLPDGCVILGKRGPNENTYATRYAINRKRQRADLCSEVMRESFYPCTLEENRGSLWKVLWALTSSEAFIFTLHMTVLVVGVTKEALNLRSVDEDLHLVHSVIETFLALLMIIIRITSVRGKFQSIRGHVTAVEYVEDPTSDNIRGKDLRKWLHGFYFLGAFLIVLVVTCFLLFYFLVHLGWTILSNNFALVLITVSSNLLLDRLGNVIARITEDQHKAVIYETVLLLQEAYGTTIQDKETKEGFLDKMQKISNAIIETELFEKPEHIEVSEYTELHWDPKTTMEMQSSV